MMTSDEYVKRGGTACPACESHDIEGSEVNIDAGFADQEIECNECGATWRDVYKLAECYDVVLGSISTVKGA